MNIREIQAPGIFWQDGSRNTSPSCQRGPLDSRAARRCASRGKKGIPMKQRQSGPRYAANQLVTVRVTPEEKRRLRENAALIGVSLSTYVRTKMFGGRPLIPRTDEWTIRELRRMGGLLKQHFFTLRKANVSRDFLLLHEKLLHAIRHKIDAIGTANRDCEEDQM